MIKVQICLLFILALTINVIRAYGQIPSNGKSSIETLLSRIDLNSTGLGLVKQSTGHPVQAAEELLNYRPVPDNEWVWQLNRMSFWNDLALAYWHTGDEKYAKEWCTQLVDWTMKNPNDTEHNYAWRSIEAGIRGNRWTGLFQYFIDSPEFTPEVMVEFLNSYGLNNH